MAEEPVFLRIAVFLRSKRLGEHFSAKRPRKSRFHSHPHCSHPLACVMERSFAIGILSAGGTRVRRCSCDFVLVSFPVGFPLGHATSSKAGDFCGAGCGFVRVMWNFRMESTSTCRSMLATARTQRVAAADGVLENNFGGRERSSEFRVAILASGGVPPSPPTPHPSDEQTLAPSGAGVFFFRKPLKNNSAMRL